MTNVRIPQDLQAWIDARKRFHLSHAQVQMARELGMNPKKLGSKANHKQERWKMPLSTYIEQLYFRRFGKTKPDAVLSIEERAKQKAAKKEASRQARLERKTQKEDSPAPLPGDIPF